MRTRGRHPSHLHTGWNFLGGGCCWEAGSGPSLEVCKSETDADLWGCCKEAEVICVTRHQMRWLPSSLAVSRIKGPVNNGSSSVQSPWGEGQRDSHTGWTITPLGSWLGGQQSSARQRTENSGAPKGSNHQSISIPSAYRNQPHRQSTRKNESVNPGWGGRNHKAVLSQEINQR